MPTYGAIQTSGMTLQQCTENEVDQVLEWLGAHIASILSICAMSITLYQAYLSRFHNMVMVRPHVTQEVHKYSRDKVGYIEFVLVNDGLGPAFVTHFDVYFFGESVTLEDGVSRSLKGIPYSLGSTTLRPGSAIRSSQSITVLSLSFPVGSDHDFDKLEHLLKGLDLELHYRCAYGRQFRLDTRNSN